jgi:phosphorylcholine metabolism protein LicD
MAKIIKKKTLRKEKTTLTHWNIKQYFNSSLGFGEHKPLAIDLLKQTTKILEQYNINYCLISGTLLGFIRHNDFIPWDDDIDLLVDDSIFEKMNDISKDNSEINLFYKNKTDSVKVCFESKGFDLPKNDIADSWRKKPLKAGARYSWPFIDLFAYESSDNLKFFAKEWISNEFLPFKKVNFLGIDTFIPNNSNYFLKKNYGLNYMTELKSSSHSHKKEQKISEIRFMKYEKS